MNKLVAKMSFAFVGVVLLLPSNSWAAGEPKNEAPFNRAAVGTTATLDVFERYVAAHPYGRGVTTVIAPETVGEAKNDAPFNRTISAPVAPDRHSSAAAQPDGHGRGAAFGTHGEAKNQMPFVRAAARQTTAPNSATSAASQTPSVSSAAFHWRDALIGASVATLILLCAAAGGATRLRPRNPIGV
jgi:hypothetical protein